MTKEFDRMRRNQIFPSGVSERAETFHQSHDLIRSAFPHLDFPLEALHDLSKLVLEHDMIGGLATFFALSYLIVHPVIGSAGPGPQTLSSLAQAHFTHLREPSIASDRYDGHQVWRLDWRTIDQELKTDILLAIEVGTSRLSECISLSHRLSSSTSTSGDPHLQPSISGSVPLKKSFSAHFFHPTFHLLTSFPTYNLSSTCLPRPLLAAYPRQI